MAMKLSSLSHNDLNYIGKENKQIIKKIALNLFNKCCSNNGKVQQIKELTAADIETIQNKLNKGEINDNFIKPYIREDILDSSDLKILFYCILLMARHQNFVYKDGKRSHWFSNNTSTLNQFLKEINKVTKGNKVSNSMNSTLLKLINIMALKIFSNCNQNLGKLNFSDVVINFDKMNLTIGNDDYKIKEIQSHQIILSSKDKQEKYQLWLNKHNLYLIPSNKDMKLIKYDLLVEGVDEIGQIDEINQINQKLIPSVKSFFSQIINDSTKSENFTLGNSNGSIGREILAAIQTKKLKLNQEGLDCLIKLLNSEYEALYEIFQENPDISIRKKKFQENPDISIRKKKFQENPDISIYIEQILDNAKFVDNDNKLIFMGNSIFGELTNNMVAHMYFRNILSKLKNVIYIKGLHDDVGFGFQDNYEVSFNWIGSKTTKVINKDEDELKKGRFANLKLDRLVLEQHVKQVFSNCHYSDDTNTNNKVLYINSGWRNLYINFGWRDKNRKKVQINTEDFELDTAFGKFASYNYKSIHDLINAINLSRLNINTYFRTKECQIEYTTNGVKNKYGLTLTIITDQQRGESSSNYYKPRCI